MERNKTVHRLSTVDKAISLLSLFLKYDTVGLVEIEQELDISKTAAFRLASTLTDRGFLVKNNHNKTYQPGPIIFQIVNKFQSNDITAIANPYIQALAQKTNETVYLSIRTGNKFVFLSGIESSHPLKVTSPLGDEMDLYYSAVGKLHMAYMSKKDLATYFKRTTFEKYTDTTLIDSNTLLNELEEIRKLGYSVSHGERIADFLGLAAPIWGFGEEPIAALTLLLPISRVDDSWKQQLITLLCETAQEISKAFQQLENA
ncbi:MAG: IclR family transcriptional regulator [Lysinibacillus sp.]